MFALGAHIAEPITVTEAHIDLQIAETRHDLLCRAPQREEDKEEWRNTISDAYEYVKECQQAVTNAEARAYRDEMAVRTAGKKRKNFEDDDSLLVGTIVHSNLHDSSFVIIESKPTEQLAYKIWGSATNDVFWVARKDVTPVEPLKRDHVIVQSGECRGCKGNVIGIDDSYFIVKLHNWDIKIIERFRCAKLDYPTMSDEAVEFVKTEIHQLRLDPCNPKKDTVLLRGSGVSVVNQLSDEALKHLGALCITEARNAFAKPYWIHRLMMNLEHCLVGYHVGDFWPAFKVVGNRMVSAY